MYDLHFLGRNKIIMFININILFFFLNIDDFDEMTDTLSGSKIMYAYCRIHDPNTDLPKYVLVNWVSEMTDTCIILVYTCTYTYTCNMTEDGLYLWKGLTLRPYFLMHMEINMSVVITCTLSVSC